MKIAVIGAGYVGLTTAACLAEIGHSVLCAESDLQKLEFLQKGGMPFFEPHLAPLVSKNVKNGRLSFVTTPEAIQHGIAIFICVGTPPMENGEADLTALEGVARMIAQQASGFRLVIEKSTVPVQTGRQLQKHLGLYKRTGFDCDVASNPEFLREGSAVEDFFHPDRIVAGIENPGAARMLEEIYQPVIEQRFSCPVHQPDLKSPTSDPQHCPQQARVPLLITDINSAELIKHASNSFLAMKISFINLIADLCEAAGADISKVAEGIGLDRRIGKAFLKPGIGFGGFCFPKDLQAFIHIAEKLGLDFSLLQGVERINLGRVTQFVEKVKKELWVLRGKKIAVWGLAFKPNTDDVRFAPSLAIIRRLVAEGAEVSTYDPEAASKAAKELSEIRYCNDPYEAVEGAEALLVLTEWEEFGRVDLDRVRASMVRPLMIDGRNMFSPENVTAHGIEYVGIGKSAAEAPVASQR